MSRKAKNADGAKQLLKFLGSAAAENTYLKTDPNDVGTSVENAIFTPACSAFLNPE